MKRTLLVALALCSAPVTLVPAPAQAAACSSTSGVTVVVQFPDRTETRCAAGDPTSGSDALARAGFSVTRVTKFPGAVCRIDGFPDAGADPCVNMPPADAYWVYFHAQPGGSWTPSNVGADGYNPKPGSVEGWRFGDGDAPSTLPPAPAPTPRPSATPKPAPSATKAPSAPKPGTSSTAGSGATRVSSPTGSATPAPTASGTRAPGADPSPTTTESATAAGPVVADTGTDAGTDAGRSDGGASWVWGVGLLAVLGAVGGAVAIRRRG
jgi:hypothetical protein